MIDVLAISKIFNDSLDLVDVAETGVEGTLTLMGVMSALNVIPSGKRAEFMFWDIGWCGRGNVLLAAMVFGYGYVTGLEQNDNSAQWELRLRKAHDICRASAHAELWSQRDPVVWWKTRVVSSSDLDLCFQKYRWHRKVITFLFWTAWQAGHKEIVLNFICKQKQITDVLIVDEIRRPQGHKLAFGMLSLAGFTMHKYRSGLSMARTSGSETFTLLYWKR